MEWQVGQWVRDCDNLGQVERVSEDTVYVKHVKGGRSIAYGVDSEWLRPFVWQVGRTYKTTLEGVTGSIRRVDSVGDFFGEVNGSHCDMTTYWHRDGRDYNENRRANLTTELADEPQVEPSPRFTVVRRGEKWGVADSEKPGMHAPFGTHTNACRACEEMTNAGCDCSCGFVDDEPSAADIEAVLSDPVVSDDGSDEPETYERELIRLSQFIQSRHAIGSVKHIGLLEAVQASEDVIREYEKRFGALESRKFAEQEISRICGEPYDDGSDPPDVINNPPHYNQGDIECIDAIQAALSPEEFRGHLRACALKYLWRCNHKGGREDLLKAEWYLKRLNREMIRGECASHGGKGCEKEGGEA